MATRRYEITAGPSKFDLMIALFTGKDVFFELADEGGRSFQITGLSNAAPQFKECEEWLFTGLRRYDYEHPEVNGRFSTRTRKGYLETEACL